MAGCIILTTTDEEKIAHDISNKLLQSEFAACVQIDKVDSFFKWDGNITNTPEYRLMIKAKADNYKKIEKTIKDIHNYSLPEIIKIDITDGLKEYINWL